MLNGSVWYVYAAAKYYVHMRRRTTIEIDETLLARAKKALGSKTTRATVEESLRRAAQGAETATAARSDGQRRYLERLASRADLTVLGSEEMWR
jgi:Arc/MetJ family transcription regulator